MTPEETKKVAELRQWADRCERQGRTSQAILVRNMAYEIEHGAPWLAQLSQLAEPVEHESALQLDSDDGSGLHPSQR